MRNFREFTFILAGMVIIGFSVGIIFGFFLADILRGNWWVYLSAPIMGIGCGLVIYGAVFNRNRGK